MFFVKYGINPSPQNLAGTSLDVDAFSDAYGNTEVRQVVHGDVVLTVTGVDEETGQVSGEFYDVRDGQPWVRSEINDWVDSGNALCVVAVCTDLVYQAGAMSVFLPNGTFINANLGITLNLIEQAISSL